MTDASGEPVKFDGVGFGVGPARPWSHYRHGDERCDVKYVYNEATRVLWCPECGAEVTEELACAIGIRLSERPRRQAPTDIPGYRWTGEFYERIGPAVTHDARCRFKIGRRCNCGALP